MFFILAGLLGLSDGVFNTQLYALLGSWFEGRAEAAFANLKLCQAGSAAIAFFLDSYMSFHAKCITIGAALSIGVLLLLAYDIYGRCVLGVKGSLLDGAEVPTPMDEKKQQANLTVAKLEYCPPLQKTELPA